MACWWHVNCSFQNTFMHFNVAEAVVVDIWPWGNEVRVKWEGRLKVEQKGTVKEKDLSGDYRQNINKIV